MPTVLIADDAAVNRAVLSAILRGASLQVLQAQDGEEALRLVREARPDLLLLDVMMPKLDGFGVLLELQADLSLGELPVIFVTSKGEAADKVRALTLGAADYITKPFDTEEVLARVRTQLRLRQLARSLARANDELRSRQELIDQDLRAAAAIQRALLPRGALAVRNWRAAAAFLPSQHVGGDLFHLMPVGNRHAAAWVLDVSGHGVGAAMITVSVAQRLGSLTLTDGVPTEPGKVLATLDREYPLERFDRFFTMAYALIDLRSGELRYACAGHPPSVVQRRTGELSELSQGGTLIGLGTAEFPHESTQLLPGDRLFLYTDGLVEYESGAGEAFGKTRLEAALSSSRAFELEDAKDLVVAAALHHGGDAPPDDDVTLLALEWSGPEVRLALAFDSRLEEVRAASQRLRSFLEAEGVQAGEADALELCFVEAANNSVLHAYGSAGGEVALECIVHPDRVILAVRDRGRPRPDTRLNTPPEVSPVPVAIPALAESGRGMPLLRALTDRLDLRSGPSGNEVWMEKLRGSSSGPA